jgi:hypothetical protein
VVRGYCFIQGDVIIRIAARLIRSFSKLYAHDKYQHQNIEQRDGDHADDNNPAVIGGFPQQFYTLHALPAFIFFSGFFPFFGCLKDSAAFAGDPVEIQRALRAEWDRPGDKG